MNTYVKLSNEHAWWIYELVDQGLLLINASQDREIKKIWYWESVVDIIGRHSQTIRMDDWNMMTEEEVFLELL